LRPCWSNPCTPHGSRGWQPREFVASLRLCPLRACGRLEERIGDVLGQTSGEAFESADASGLRAPKLQKEAGLQPLRVGWLRDSLEAFTLDRQRQAESSRDVVTFCVPFCVPCRPDWGSNSA
jgi:hypothetical protein